MTVNQEARGPSPRPAGCALHATRTPWCAWHLLVAPVVLACALLLGGVGPTFAADAPDAAPIMVPNPGADLWRAVRQRDTQGGGQTQARGVDAGVLINHSGEDFRQYRRQDFIGTAGWFVVGAAGVILLFYLLRGKVRIPDGRSGHRIQRFIDYERTLHWFTAVVFLFLAVTGLILLFGRFLLLPVIGPEAFGVIASACKEGHNLFGPLFLVGVLLFLIHWARQNLPARGDLMWLIKGGGIVGKAHVTAGYFNTGEKLWYWAVIALGLAVSLSGLVLLFPVLGQGRDVMQLALIVHGAVAVLFIAGSLGHIYIGTVGSEGSLEGMTTGYVDENWARAHHDRWYAEVRQAGAAEQARERPPASLVDPAPPH